MVRRRHAAGADVRRRCDTGLWVERSGGGGIGGVGVVDEDVVGAGCDAAVVDDGRRRGRRGNRTDGGVTDLVVGDDQQRWVDVGRRPTARAG